MEGKTLLEVFTEQDRAEAEPAPNGPSLRDCVAALFRENDGQWINAQRLMAVGGMFGWRSRVSDCRKQLCMFIENRQSKEGKFTVTEYRYTSGGFTLISEHATRRENR